MKKYMKQFTLLVILMASVQMASAQVMTQLVYEELQAVDIKSKTLVIADVTYKYSSNTGDSNYRSPDDKKNELSLFRIKPGEKYYFELRSEGRDIRDNKFTHVIFISGTEPAE